MAPRAALGLLATAALLAGCIAGRPTCDDLPTKIELRLAADSLTPADPAMCRDRSVALTVTSSVDGVLHIHGYDAEATTNVSAGESVDIRFTTTRSGQFPIELHTDGDTQGTGVGVFTVHEP